MEAADYDLIVAGAGPAGSACAITAARKGARVLLLEKDRFPRHKVCGEFVSAESLGLLKMLQGSSDLESHPALDKARLFFGKRLITLPIAPPARTIPRFELDAQLFAAAQRAGVHTEEAATVREVRQESLFDVVSTQRTWNSRAVVNCTGRWSLLTQPAARQNEKWIGLKAHFAETRPAQSIDLYFFRGGYCGVAPVSEATVNACAMVQAGAARSLEEVFSLHPELYRRSRDWSPLFAPVSTSPLYFRAVTPLDGRMLLAGDSAGFIDPFAGDGISLALQSGALAAESLTPFLQGEEPLEEALSRYALEYRNRFSSAFRSAAWLRKFLSVPAWLLSPIAGLAKFKPVGHMMVRSTRAR